MDIPSTGPVKLKANLTAYPTTTALLEGKVSSPLVEFDYCGPAKAHDGFKDMLRRNAYDVGELAIVTYLQAKAYNKPWALIPVPISARPQHHCAGYNIDFGHLDPKDIEGKKVGVRTYAQTTGLWIRGVLQHEYGVDLDKVTFMTTGEGHLEEYADPPNCVRLPKGTDIGQMMLDGELAATLQGIDLPKDPRVRTLVPDAKAAGVAWCEREGVVPINHMFVVHQDLVDQRPDVVREIYRLLAESRNAAPPEALKLFPPVGMEANRKGVELAIQWAFEQKIIPRRFSYDELFDETTAALNG
jgi:4,5-dihydroxyphthalate decarboxylase